MFEVTIFTELLIAGLFILVGLWPLFLLVRKESQALKREEGVGSTGELELPAAAQAGGGGAEDDPFPIVDAYVSKVKKVVIMLLLAYAVGAAANRLADDFWDDLVFKRYKLDERYEETLRQETRSLREQQLAGLPPADLNWQSRIRCEGKEMEKSNNCLKVAHMLLRERSEATREWLDNRRAYIRIMRAASLSLVLLIISMFIYKVRWWKKSRRYRISHFALALFFLCAITYAHKEAEEKYWNRVYELYTGLPPVAAKAEK